MKKLIHNLRIWLLCLLHGVPEECEETYEDAVFDYIKQQRVQICELEDTVSAYRNAVREICRRSENSYYDWCCEYCSTDCEWPAHWCARFKP